MMLGSIYVGRVQDTFCSVISSISVSSNLGTKSTRPPTIGQAMCDTDDVIRTSCNGLCIKSLQYLIRMILFVYEAVVSMALFSGTGNGLYCKTIPVVSTCMDTIREALTVTKSIIIGPRYMPKSSFQQVFHWHDLYLSTIMPVISVEQA